MTTDLLEVALEALRTCRIMAQDDDGNYTREITPKIIRDAIAKLEAAKLEAQPADPLGVQPCCGEYATCGRPRTPRGEWIATNRAQPVGIPAGIREFLEHWIHDSHLQTFEDRQRFRAAAADLLSAAPALPVEPPITQETLDWFTLGEEMHPRTRNLVVRFARALAAKLAAAEKKYGYTDGWASPDWMDECRVKLLEHIAKGDPRDVAAYCMFLWHHGEKTTPPAAPTVELPVVAWAHDGEGRIDVAPDKLIKLWLEAKPNHVEHYTIALVRLSDAQAAIAGSRQP